MSKQPAFSYLIPSTPEMNARTWMMRIWQTEFPQGATIDQVARFCVEASAKFFGAPIGGMQNDEYQRVHMLSMELHSYGLLYTAGPSAPPFLKPARPWYEATKPAHFEETPTDSEESTTP